MGLDSNGVWISRIPGVNPPPPPHEYRKTVEKRAKILPNGKTKTPDSIVRFANSLNGRLYNLVKGARGSSRDKNLECTLTVEIVKEKWESQGGICPYTGWAMTTESHSPKLVSLERINPNAGYTPENTVLACWRANRAKSIMTTEEFIDMCKAVAAKNP